MNWKLVLLLSLFGLFMGLSTVYFIPSNVEPFFWLAIFLFCAFIITRKAEGKYFLHGLMVSLANFGACAFVCRLCRKSCGRGSNDGRDAAFTQSNDAVDRASCRRFIRVNLGSLRVYRI
ncbi:MAG: hypothetical protein ACKOXB_08015 [Flavobacteriales bacterium]